jgi:LysM repeat protein
MKRRTRLIVIGCATLGGTLTTAAQAASASPVALEQALALRPAHTLAARPTATPSRVHQAAATAPPKVPAALPKVTVQAGDSLSAIGARTSRTWVQLASYNHVANPDVIYPGQVLTIPPATYAPVGVSTPPPAGSPVSQAPVSTYAPAPVATSSGSGIWGCIAAHESGGNPGTNTGNGYYGMYQDTQSSWVSGGGLAYAPRADLASAAAQTAVNQRIQAQQGWGAWPVTSRMCGA